MEIDHNNDEAVVNDIITENKNILSNFLLDDYNDYNYNNESYIYLLLNSSRNSNLFAKLVKIKQLKEIKENELKHLIFIKVHTIGLYNLLILRMDIREVVNEYNDKLMMIGSFVLNDFKSINRITADYSPTSTINYSYIRWFSFQCFSSFSLTICEQVFTTVILNRDDENPWCLAHIKSTKKFKVPSNCYVSLYGIKFNTSTISDAHKFRKIITKQVGKLCTNGDISGNKNIFSTVF